MGNEIDFALVVGFWGLVAFVALSALYGLAMLVCRIVDNFKERAARKERINGYIEMMYQDWREHPEHAQGRKLPEDRDK